MISHNKTVFYFLYFDLNKIINYCLLLKFFTVDTPTTTPDQLEKIFYMAVSQTLHLRLWHQVGVMHTA